MWYIVRVVEQFSDKCRELSGSYPSTCFVIGLDNSRQLISIIKMPTKNSRDLVAEVFRQVVFLQVVSVFFILIFFPFEFTMVSLDIFFYFDRRLWLDTQTKSAPRILGIVLPRELYDDMFEPSSALLWNYVALNCFTSKNSNKFMSLKLRPVVISKIMCVNAHQIG